MAEDTIKLELEEFDRWAAGRFTALADVMRKASEQMEDADAEIADYLASAAALEDSPPHKGQWIAIKKVLSRGDVSDARAAGLKRDDAGRTYHDEAAYGDALMAAAVTAWSLADDDGTPWPVGLAGIRRLPEVLADWLLSQVEEQRASYLRTREQMARLKSGAARGKGAA